MTAAEDRSSLIEEAGQALWEAAVSGTAINPVRHRIGAADVDAAYAIQETLTRRRLQGGARVIGRKIGLTSEAVQKQLGVDQPDFGVLFDDMSRSGATAIELARLVAPRIEAEVAVVLADDLDGDDLTVAAVRERIAFVCPALEIVDSRVRDWDISIVDTVADNASSALFVVGEERTDVVGLDLSAITMEMTADGSVVSSGSGHACLGDPLVAVLWLARTCLSYGSPLRAGELVLSGALGPMVPVAPTTTYTATLSQLGSVSAAFGPAPIG